MRASADRHRWLRRAPALAATALVVACTASGGTSATGSHRSAPPQAAASAGECRSEPAPDGKIVLGVISLGRYLPERAVPVHQGWWRYWQKHGIEILEGHQAVTITVPAPWRNRAAITWGANAGVVSTLRLPGTLLSPGCPVGPLKWSAYAGGFYLRSSSACVPLVFTVGQRSAVVRVGVDRRCVRIS